MDNFRILFWCLICKLYGGSSDEFQLENSSHYSRVYEFPKHTFYIHSFTPFMIGQPIKGYRLVEIQPLNSEVKFEGRKDWK